MGLCAQKLMKGTVFRMDIACRQTYSGAIFVVVVNASEGPSDDEMRRRVLIVCAGAAIVCYAATQPAIIVTCLVLISIGTTLEFNT